MNKVEKDGIKYHLINPVTDKEVRLAKLGYRIVRQVYLGGVWAKNDAGKLIEIQDEIIAFNRNNEKKEIEQ